MKYRLFCLTATSLALVLVITGCAPQATASPVDEMATNIARGVALVRTATAKAPTPLPSATLTPTATIPPTSAPIQQPVVVKLAGCWFGPGPSYNMESSIPKGQSVELLGVGSVPGWYIIRNPYFFQPCWIQAASLGIDPRMDLTQLPVVTPYPLRTPYPQKPPKP
ncbi:MAG TPA: hypothetical protein VLZ89_05320 [Anaerolineales bacterium]|nr:hypothetical protein [Anaerolineales bacterium]